MNQSTAVPSPELYVPPAVSEAWRGLDRLNERALTFVRERPGACMLGALTFGFVVGKIAARR